MLQVSWRRELKKVMLAQVGCVIAVASNQTGKTQLLIPVLPLTGGEWDLPLNWSVSTSISSCLSLDDWCLLSRLQ